MGLLKTLGIVGFAVLLVVSAPFVIGILSFLATVLGIVVIIKIIDASSESTKDKD